MFLRYDDLEAIKPDGVERVTHIDDVPVAKVKPPFPPRAAVMSCKFFCRECNGVMRTPTSYNEESGEVWLICKHHRNVVECKIEVRR